MLTEQNCLARGLLISCNAGTVVLPGDIEGIKAAILKYYAEFFKGELRSKSHSEIVQNFDRKFLTLRLSEIFNDLWQIKK